MAAPSNEKKLPSIEFVELLSSGVSDTIVADINRLLPQLTSTVASVTQESLVEMLDGGTTQLFIALSNEHVVATTLLCRYTGLVGVKYYIEDVVTDSPYRGQGVSSSLLTIAEQSARDQGATHVNLTSSPTRKDAWSLYLGRGYKIVNTAVFRKHLQTDE